MQIAPRRTVLAAVAALFLAACGGSDNGATAVNERMIEEALETAGSGSIDITTNDGGDFSIETEDGSLTVKASDSLPDDFPASVRIPSGWVIESSSNMSSGDQLGWVLFFVLPADSESAIAQLGDSLPAAGFTELTNFTTNDGAGVSAVLGWENDEYVVSAVIAPGVDDAPANASLTVASKTG